MVFSGIGDLLNLFPDAIDADDRRNIIRNWLPGLIEEGYSANASLDLFRSVGLGIGRQDYLAIYRNVLGIEEQTNRIRFVPRSSTPSDSLFGVSQVDLDTDYRFIMKFDTFDEETGIISSKFINYDTNFYGSINEIEDNALENIVERYPHLAGRINSIRTWKAFRSE